MIYGNAKCFAAKKLVKHATIAENYAARAREKIMIIASLLSVKTILNFHQIATSFLVNI
jgi:hypothetical protein